MKKLKIMFFLIIPILLFSPNIVYGDETNDSLTESFVTVENRIVTGNNIQLVLDNTIVNNFYWQYFGSNESHNNLTITVSEGLSQIICYGQVSEQQIIQKDIYFYNKLGYTFISFYSEDSALNNGLNYLTENNLLEQSEAETISIDYYDNYELEYEVSYLPESEPSAAPLSAGSENSSVAKGKIMLEYKKDDGTYKTIPFKFVKVRLFAKIGSIETEIASGFTNEDGYFNIPYPNQNVENYQLYYKIKVESYTFSINTATIYYTKSDYMSDVNDGDITNFGKITYLYAQDNLSDAFYIHQAMVMGQEFVRNISPMALKNDNDINSDEYKHLSVFYPYFSTSFSFKGHCFIEEKGFKSERFYLPLHEYAHFVEQSMGLYSATIDEIIKNNPNHSEIEDHFEYKEEKEYAMELTWTESWANAFAYIVQFENEEEYFETDTFLEGKERYETVNQPGYPLLGDDEKNNLGEAQELAVTGFLLDLYDNPSMYPILGEYKETDNVCISAYNWFLDTTNLNSYAITTLTEFAKAIMSAEKENLLGIGELFSTFRISPKILSITNIDDVDKDVAPIITFHAGGSTANYNNKIELAIFDDRLVMIDKIEWEKVPISNKKEEEFEISTSFWQSIGEGMSDKEDIYICILGYNIKDKQISGGYFSNFIKLEITYEHICSFNFRYLANSDKVSHTAYCICGKTKYEICVCDFNRPGPYKCEKCRQLLRFVPSYYHRIGNPVYIENKKDQEESE